MRLTFSIPFLLAAILVLAPAAPGAAAAEVEAGDIEAGDIEAAMVRAATFFRDRLSVEGSYVWRYRADDLARRRGEDGTTLSQGWSQPPGTPAVGLAFLAAYKATGRGLFLEAATETAEALRRTQLESGGWQGPLEFDPAARAAWCYRVDAGRGRPDCEAIEDNKLKNATTIDDNITQAPLTFLMLLEAELGDQGEALDDAVRYGLERLLEMQYPNGSWPFRSDFKIPDDLTASAWRARYPKSWSRTFVPPRGEVYFTNDHLMRGVIRLFLLAADLHGEPAYAAAARRGGDFLLSARMPAPQPGWAQNYNADLEPIWGRKFEPPAIASYETASSIEALLELYQATGEPRYLEGAGPAARWLEGSRLPGGGWARFYELVSNRPLYIDTGYRVTYDDAETPDHYRFKGGFGVLPVLERHRRLAAAGDQPPAREPALSPVPGEAEVRAILAALDGQGRWVEDGVIRSGRFVANLTALASAVAARRGRPLEDYLRPIAHQLEP